MKTRHALMSHTMRRVRAWSCVLPFLPSVLLPWPFMSAQAATPVSPPQVTTPLGTVGGGKLANGVRNYLGLRYATAERWKAPQATAPWTGVVDASQGGAACPQLGKTVAPGGESEDCLFLDVHVPDDIGTDKLPVMVWVHGGGFAGGQGSGDPMDKTRLVKAERVIIVSINYRLAAYGHLALPELVAENPHLNFSLQDQQAALRWVKANIAAFGGDPARVTLFGESAGGVGVCLNLVSPQSAGLFERAITQSGSCAHTNPIRSPVRLVAGSQKLARELGCPDGAGQLACLRAKPAQAIDDKVAEYAGQLLNPLTAKPDAIDWMPVIDGISLTDRPDRLLTTGRFNRVPVIMGSNHDEARLHVSGMHLSRLWKRVRQAELDAYVLKLLNGDARLATLASAGYTRERYGSLDKAMAAVITDATFACPVNRDLAAASRFVPAWEYEFNDIVPGSQIVDPIMYMGAVHGLDLPYLFQIPMPGLPIQFPLSAKQKVISLAMGRYWANFARTGNPNGADVPAWPTYNGLSTPIQNLEGGALATQAPFAFASDHQCMLWALLNGLMPEQPSP
jgi:para-nitrobenzyl esterase